MAKWMAVLMKDEEMTERYGNRRVPKMLAQVNAHRAAVAAEGTPLIQDTWDKIEEHIDFAYAQNAVPSQVTVKPVAWIANCCICGRIIDTREKETGGDEFGAAVDGDRWACSSKCWHEATDAAHPAPVSVVPDDAAMSDSIKRYLEDCAPVDLVEYAEAQAAELVHWKADSAAAWDKCEERRLAQERAEAEVACLIEELAQVKGLLEKAREWNWIDFEEAKKAGDEVEAFLPDLCRLDAEITAALVQPNLQLSGPKVEGDAPDQTEVSSGPRPDQSTDNTALVEAAQNLVKWFYTNIGENKGELDDIIAALASREAKPAPDAQAR